ncbi:MAG: helix-turn-helix domain-containing protein [Betaproteobacteria bacterium]|nr:helix-turn-helix domain-containing protein [Betaproteobacteria bacterium]MBA3775696.1 helix-turn-helix domain-containing protein [Betaproteobacteria bacterium]
MTVGPDTLTPATLHDRSVTAGPLLAEAREAAGLTLATVAQQLKLAPRQVKALEEDDFAHLPERTFVRGFVRNYARLLHLDPALVLAALPDANIASTLDHPSLAGSSRVMGELPKSLPAHRRPARWAIPLALAAIVAITAAYELTRPPADAPVSMSANPAVGSGTASLTAPIAPAAPADPSVASLPNPLLADPLRAQSAAVGSTSPASASPVAAFVPDGIDAPLVLAFRGASWAEVKDRGGAVVLSTIGINGATHSVRGSPPFDVWLGNADVVTVTYRGQPVDLAPYTKQNVARLTLQ